VAVGFSAVLGGMVDTINDKISGHTHENETTCAKQHRHKKPNISSCSPKVSHCEKGQRRSEKDAIRIENPRPCSRPSEEDDAKTIRTEEKDDGTRNQGLLKCNSVSSEFQDSTRIPPNPSLNRKTAVRFLFRCHDRRSRSRDMPPEADPVQSIRYGDDLFVRALAHEADLNPVFPAQITAVVAQ